MRNMPGVITEQRFTRILRIFRDYRGDHNLYTTVQDPIG